MTLKQTAEHYRCSLSTVNRMKAAGVDLSDPVQVAIHLVTLQDPSAEMLARTVEILTSEDHVETL
jgi:hypothetical protein